MLLSNTVFFVSRKSYPDSNLIQFCSKGNNKSKSVSKMVLQSRSKPVIPRNIKTILSPCAYPFSKIAVKWHYLSWPCKSPKFNLHHLRKTPMGYKMTVLIPKSGIVFQWWFQRIVSLNFHIY